MKQPRINRKKRRGLQEKMFMRCYIKAKAGVRVYAITTPGMFLDEGYLVYVNNVPQIGNVERIHKTRGYSGGTRNQDYIRFIKDEPEDGQVILVIS